MSFILFDMQSGISGDMAVAAALDFGIDEREFRSKLSTLDLKFEITVEKVDRGGIAATRFSVDYPHQHQHRHLSHINDIILRSGLPVAVKERARAIFLRLAEAEAKVDNTAVEKVHFHEVGAVDSIVDIVGASLVYTLIGAEEFFLTPFCFGTGTIKCDHGVMPIPAPATAELTRGFPVRRSTVEAELVTPTGAAIATTLGRPAAELGEYTISAIGYGAGSREIPGQANVLRILKGDRAPGNGLRVVEMQTNLDDTTGEIVGRTMERLMENGALDAFTTSVGMKKGRPGVLVTVLCQPAEREKLSRILLEETGSIGLRFSEKERICLTRSSGVVATAWGMVKVKVIDLFGEERITPEYESCRQLAIEKGVPVRIIYEEVIRVKGFVKA